MVSKNQLILGIGSCAIVALSLYAAGNAYTKSSDAASAQADLAKIAALNHAIEEAGRDLDNTADVALWEEDGVAFFPALAPLRGRAAILKHLDDFKGSNPQLQVEVFDLACFDQRISGRLASEWCQEHWVMRASRDSPSVHGSATLLLVLHRGADDTWRRQNEMWSLSPPDRMARATEPVSTLKLQVSSGFL